MEMKGSGEFRNYSDDRTFSTSWSSLGQNGQYGQVYHTNNAYAPQTYQPGGYQGQHGMGYQAQQQDPRMVNAKRKEGLTRLRNFGIISIVLAVITCAVGVAILVVASSNIGFPVFNFGILLVGFLHLLAGILCYRAGKVGLDSVRETSTEIPGSVKGLICGQFALSVTLITFAILSGVFAFLSGALCAGADIKFRSRNNGVETELDVKQYCEPNNDANSVLAFVGGSLCMLIAILSIYGSSWVCCYGPFFGWKKTGHGRVVYT